LRSSREHLADDAVDRLGFIIDQASHQGGVLL
jgi:hypothetical protein